VLKEKDKWIIFLNIVIVLCAVDFSTQFQESFYIKKNGGGGVDMDDTVLHCLPFPGQCFSLQHKKHKRAQLALLGCKAFSFQLVTVPLGHAVPFNSLLKADDMALL
jgi:hypothetical protein